MLKETMTEKDENGKFWFTEKNLSGFMYNLVGAGMIHCFFSRFLS